MNLLENQNPNALPLKKWTLFHERVWDHFINPGEAMEVRIPKAFGSSEAWGTLLRKGQYRGISIAIILFAKLVKRQIRSSMKVFIFPFRSSILACLAGLITD